jgi:hypothetical protein
MVVLGFTLLGLRVIVGFYRNIYRISESRQPSGSLAWTFGPCCGLGQAQCSACPASARSKQLRRSNLLACEGKTSPLSLGPRRRADGLTLCFAQIFVQ